MRSRCILCIEEVTEPDLQRVVAWSFDILLLGKHPHADHLGSPWPAGIAHAKRAEPPWPETTAADTQPVCATGSEASKRTIGLSRIRMRT